tara:strand:- start:623 stop:1444 length:822 start_codon:yes stop_codon:yes gene_type:complete
MEFDNEYIEALLNSSNSNLKENNLHREFVPRRYWIKEYIQKYEFFSKFVFGKILDYNSNNSLSFLSAKILLNNNVTNVFSYYNKTNEISKRTLVNGRIHYEKPPEKNEQILQNIDCIISFETTFKKMNLEETIEQFSIMLNKKGKLIISIINKDKINDDSIPKNLQNILYTKKYFLKILKKYFDNVELYSQMIIEEKTISKFNILMKSLRSAGAKILSSIDKNRNFYLNYIQGIVKKTDTRNSNLFRISQEDCVPILNLDEHEPYYIIALCEK